jgi:uridine kinase
MSPRDRSSSPPAVDEIAAFVRAAPVVGGIRLVGVDGPSGGGKSTLAAALAASLRAPVVEADDFVSWDDFDGWWPRFESQVLEPLLAGRDAVFQARDWNDWYGSSLGPWKTVAWQPIVVLEGVTCTRRAVAGSLACRVWVEAPADVRLARGLARDAGRHPGARELWERWMAAEAAFFGTDGTRARADFVVETG